MPFPTSPVQVALLDDHPLFRQGMRYILQSLPYVESVVETGDFAELQGWCRQRLPDVLLLDLQMPGVDGPDAAQRLLEEFPTLKIIVLSMFSAEKFVTQMMKLGARSYLPKDVDHQQLTQALEAVLTTGHHFTSAVSQALLRGVRQPASRPAPLLFPDEPLLPDEPSLAPAAPSETHFTPRELDVLRLLCKGCPNADIAEQLFLSRRTVEGHRQRMMEKTGTTNAASLVAYAVQHGLLAA